MLPAISVIYGKKKNQIIEGKQTAYVTCAHKYKRFKCFKYFK